MNTPTILHLAEYLFTICAILGIILGILNARQARHTIRDLAIYLREHKISGNGWTVLARMHERRAVTAVIQYGFLIILGVMAILHGRPDVTTLSITLRVILLLYVLLLITSDILDIYERRRAWGMVQRSYSTERTTQPEFD